MNDDANVAIPNVMAVIFKDYWLHLKSILKQGNNNYKLVH